MHYMVPDIECLKRAVAINTVLLCFEDSVFSVARLLIESVMDSSVL